MKDASGEVIYVGKAVNLRNRVRSYFQPSSDHSPKVAVMVEHIADIDYIVTGSELEALILECNLIKKQPAEIQREGFVTTRRILSSRLLREEQ